jgi:hypothetical protein
MLADNIGFLIFDFDKTNCSSRGNCMVKVLTVTVTYQPIAIATNSGRQHVPDLAIYFLNG